jgi:NAD(P)-dependent dehydrogenase (short-subunit alcohol dehydrogenase family)
MLEGKIALVTGAGSGIGRATAIEMARHGAAVVLGDIDKVAGEETEAIIAAADGRAAFLRADITSEADMVALVDLAVARFGGLDVACNNAGYDPPVVRLADHEQDEWDRTIAVNLTAVWMSMKLEINAMLAYGRPSSIVNVASIAGQRGLWGHAPYAASKHGMLGLTRVAAVDYAKKNIRANAVCPGPTYTPMLRRYADTVGVSPDRLSAAQPMGRVGTSVEVANAIVWLSSDLSSYTTGQCLGVEGGFLA